MESLNNISEFLPYMILPNHQFLVFYFHYEIIFCKDWFIRVFNFNMYLLHLPYNIREKLYRFFIMQIKTV